MLRDGEERYQICTRIAGELRQMIGTATEIRTGLVFRLRSTAFFRIELMKPTETQKDEARPWRAQGGQLAELARSSDVSQSTISRLTVCP